MKNSDFILITICDIPDADMYQDEYYHNNCIFTITRKALIRKSDIRHIQNRFSIAGYHQTISEITMFDGTVFFGHFDCHLECLEI